MNKQINFHLTDVKMSPRLLLHSICLIDSFKSRSNSRLQLFTGGLFIVSVAIPVLSSTSTIVNLESCDIVLLRQDTINWRLPRSKSFVWQRNILETVDHMQQKI